MRKETASAKTPSQKQENWWEVCPLCGSKLVNQKCRFVCANPKCHYFQSCSEFDP